MNIPHLRQGMKKVSDLLSKYFECMSRNPQHHLVTPLKGFRRGKAAESFASCPPEIGKRQLEKEDPCGALVRQVETNIMPYLTNWNHPNFFAYYPAANSVPSVLADTLIQGFNPIGFSWSSSPISTELEVVVMDWIALLIKLPSSSPFLHRSGIGGGLIQNTAGESMFAVCAAAKFKTQKRLFIEEQGKEMEEEGITTTTSLGQDEREEIFYRDSSNLVVYMSDQTHFTGRKAARLNNMRTRVLPAEKRNGNFSLRASTVKQAMDEDRKKGFVPCLVLLTYGTTNTCGFDDLGEYHKLSKDEKDVWIHLDAAYAGASWILPDIPTPPLELCNSFNFNGSKIFLCGFDSAFLFVKNRDWMKDCFSESGEYMDQSPGERTIFDPEFKDWGVPLGRRFRSLRIWMVIEYFGAEGLREYIQKKIDSAQWLGEKIDQSSHCEQVVKATLGLVVFRATIGKNRDEMTKSLGNFLNQKGFLLYPSQVEAKTVLRVSIGSVLTELKHVKELWDAIECFFTDKTEKKELEA